PMQRTFTQVHRNGSKFAFNADRLLNRFWHYPQWLRTHHDQFDLFHIVDHSYSQLVHYLPPERTVVTCHDLETFRSILQPPEEERSFAFRAMVNRTLTGLQKAAHVACASEATRKSLIAHGLVDASRTSVV